MILVSASDGWSGDLFYLEVQGESCHTMKKNPLFGWIEYAMAAGKPVEYLEEMQV